jgi:hypothetical protein
MNDSTSDAITLPFGPEPIPTLLTETPFSRAIRRAAGLAKTRAPDVTFCFCGGDATEGGVGGVEGVEGVGSGSGVASEVFPPNSSAVAFAKAAISPSSSQVIANGVPKS